MLTAYTIAYAVHCDLATKQQQPDDIAIDSDVLPNPEQLPPDLTVNNDKDAQNRRDLRSVLLHLDNPRARVRSN
jgi:hypothetical protein